MHHGIIAVLIVVSASTGCNSSQLRFTTLKISRTVPDLQERQVLDNLARIAADPGSLPYYTVVSTGNVNIQDNGSGGLNSLALQHRIFPSAILGVNANRSVSGNWTLNTMSSPDRLRAMRAAYQIALGIGPVNPIDLTKLQGFESSQASRSPPPAGSASAPSTTSPTTADSSPTKGTSTSGSSRSTPSSSPTSAC